MLEGVDIFRWKCGRAQNTKNKETSREGRILKDYEYKMLQLLDEISYSERMVFLKLHLQLLRYGKWGNAWQEKELLNKSIVFIFSRFILLSMHILINYHPFAKRFFILFNQKVNTFLSNYTLSILIQRFTIYHNLNTTQADFSKSITWNPVLPTSTILHSYYFLKINFPPSYARV